MQVAEPRAPWQPRDVSPSGWPRPACAPSRASPRPGGSRSTSSWPCWASHRGRPISPGASTPTRRRCRATRSSGCRTARHLQEPADPAARRGQRRRLGAPTERRAAIRRSQRARAHARRQRRRFELRAPLPRRRSRRRLVLSTPPVDAVAAAPGGGVDLPLHPVRWQPAFRIVPTRYPAISLFDRVAAAEHADALYALEAMTNERLRDALGEVERVARDERVYGPGSGPIMAAFTHGESLGSRFSAGGYGVSTRRATAPPRGRDAPPPRPVPGLHRRAAMHLPMRLVPRTIDARRTICDPLAASRRPSRERRLRCRARARRGLARRRVERCRLPSVRQPAGRRRAVQGQRRKNCLHGRICCTLGQRPITDVYEKTA